MLYDYETSAVHKKSLKILSRCNIIRSGNEISLSNESENEALATITHESNKFFLVATNYSPIWLVIRNSRNSIEPYSYTLSEGTIIKLGRLQFQVKAIKTKDETFEEVTAEVGIGKDLICKICLSENTVPDNPLISICKCSGTMRYIHIECLQQ